MKQAIARIGTFKSRIAKRLILVVVLVSSLITLITTATQLAIDYFHDMDNIERNFGIIEATYLGAISQSLWTFDDEQIGLLLTGLINLPNIEFVQLSVPGSDHWSRGEQRSGNTVTTSLPVTFMDNGHVTELGVLKVIVSLDQIYQRLLDKVVVILLGNGGKTFLISVVLLVVFHLLVTRHLNKIAETVRKFQPATDHPTIELDKSGEPDELDALVDVINDLSAELDINFLTLERRVEDRTNELVLEIAERKRAEQTLRASEEAHRHVLESLPDGAININQVGTINYTNPEAERMFGYSEDELIGKNVHILMPEPERSMHDGFLSRYLETGKARIIGIGREVTGLRKNGETFPMDLNISESVMDGRVMYLGTIRDMTERKRAERELEEAKRDAEVASRVRTEFMANMSHELRTPLNAILGYSDSIREQVFGPIDNEKYIEYVENIYESGKHLHDLIADILDITVIEAGELKLDEEQIDVREAVDASIRLIKPRAMKGGVTVTRTVPGHLPSLYGDLRRLKQILVNLLNNAVKFTNEGGSVELDVTHQDDGSLVFQVSDTGIGMNPTDLEKVMEPFQQADNSNERKYEGTGLGLPLTENLVELHGGTFSITSTLDLGTTVVVKFPPERSIDAAVCNGVH